MNEEIFIESLGLTLAETNTLVIASLLGFFVYLWEEQDETKYVLITAVLGFLAFVAEAEMLLGEFPFFLAGFTAPWIIHKLRPTQG